MTTIIVLNVIQLVLVVIILILQLFAVVSIIRIGSVLIDMANGLKSWFEEPVEPERPFKPIPPKDTNLIDLP